MSSKRLKNSDNQPTVELETETSLDSQILASDINDMIQVNAQHTTNTYHDSVCGSIMYSVPTRSPGEVFSYLYHNNLDGFKRSLDVHHQEIVAIRNDRNQTVLHVLVMLAYPFLWIRLLIMRGCNTCAQDADGYTAAHYAIERDEVEILKALTVQFQSQAKSISVEQVACIHEQCLRALSLRENRGLSAFMLACQRGSMKCLEYLIQSKVNDSNSQDNFGDTCLHYAVARRNLPLVKMLIEKCQADVNGGDPSRPSVLDVLQFNRQNQNANEKQVDDRIEEILLLNRARHRCAIRRVINKRKSPSDNEERMASNLSTLSLGAPTNDDVEVARNHARLAVIFEQKGDLNGAKEHYQNAMKSTMRNSIEWTDYAYALALLHQTSGERDFALELLDKALEIRLTHEDHGETIQRFKQTIENLHQNLT